MLTLKYKLMAVLGVLGAFGLIALLIAGIVANDRSRAELVLKNAAERMSAVEQIDAPWGLLNACRNTQDDIECHVNDYDISYRGHFIPASEVKVTYYVRRLPYASVTVHIERKPRLDIGPVYF